MYKEGERALITYLITWWERAYALASKASKASIKIVVKLEKNDKYNSQDLKHSASSERHTLLA
jgi:hypothetical protein